MQTTTTSSNPHSPAHEVEVCPLIMLVIKSTVVRSTIVLTAAEMRDTDRRTVEAGIPADVLMENADRKSVV